MTHQKTHLQSANEAFRNKNYAEALRLYELAKTLTPALSGMIDGNIARAKSLLNKDSSNGYQKQNIALAIAKNESPQSIDIVVPVFNALEDVKVCLKSLVDNKDGFKVRIIVVNDASDEPTSSFLKTFAQQHSEVELIQNAQNLGYTKTVNIGLKVSNADYVITQNSDTIVSYGWLTGLVNCINSESNIGICGPLSNAATWQNVPNLYDENNNHAVNSLPEGFTVQQMAQLVKDVSLKTYPKLPFVNGFCFMIKREVINKIGYMDEENFPIGYGEENDYCIRAQDAGYTLAIADDVYVYHAKSKSFGHETRKELSANGTKNLKQKHGVEKYKGLVDRVKLTQSIDDIRSRIELKLKAYIQDGTNTKNTPSIRILFLLPVKGGGGGAHSVVQEANAMRKLGLFVNVGVKHEQLDGFINNYKDISASETLFVCFDDNSIYELAANYDVVIGTVFTSMRLVKKIYDTNPHILPAYYVQDYEPMFFEHGTSNWLEAFNSYGLIPDVFLFAKTQWIIDKVYQEHKAIVHKVSPSIDHEVYKPIFRSQSGVKSIAIAAMIRPNTAYRGASRTMRILEKLHNTYDEQLKIHIFGCLESAKEFQLLERNFDYENHELLTRPQVSTLLSNCDIFIDLSDYQAFGRTALEAMACGCTSVVPKEGGANEYAIDKFNSFVVDTSDENHCFDVINKAILNQDKLNEIKNNGLLTAARYSVHQAAISEYIALSDAQRKHIALNPKVNKPTLYLIPTMRKDGLLAGSGYVRVGLPYGSSLIRKKNDVRIVDKLPTYTSRSTVIIQRDAAMFSINELKGWSSSWKKAGGKLIYEIDDDLLNCNGMVSRGFKGNHEDLVNKINLLATSADLVTVSTENLARKFEHLNSNIHIVPNLLDDDLWQLGSKRDVYSGKFGRNLDGPIKIGYIGTGTHDADLQMIAPAMMKIQKKYGDKVEIEVIGGFQNSHVAFGTRVALPKNNDYPNFVKWLLQRVNWDIGIIPLIDDEFNRSKSNLKFLEYAALDMAILVSDVEPYKSIAKNNENCLLSSSDVNSWVSQLSFLIDSESLRSKLSLNAKKDLINNFTLKSKNDFFNRVHHQ